MKKATYIIPLVAMTMACSHKATSVDTSAAYGYSGATEQTEPGTESSYTATMVPLQPEAFMPRATAFRMNGDFADNIAITLDNNGNLTYFPAPSDITADSKPIELADGWWLNRQGIGENSVFTTYTFEQYAALPGVPSQDQLKKAIIPGSRVTQMYQLPYSVGEASSHISEINALLKNR